MVLFSEKVHNVVCRQKNTFHVTYISQIMASEMADKHKHKM